MIGLPIIKIGKVTARSVSDTDETYPYWMVWDGHVNRTAEVGYAITQGTHFGDGGIFTFPAMAKHLAEAWNAWEQQS